MNGMNEVAPLTATKATVLRCGIEVDVPQILRLLGPAMYKGNVLAVACKELEQNSFDAVKHVPNPRIAIVTNRQENYIEVLDNGCGMSPETVSKVYLAIGGTLKDLDVTERSGGLGLAKVQFFLSACRMQVETVKDGVTTFFDCTQEELMTGNVEVSVQNTGRKSGTRVRLYYPKEVHAIDGSVTKIQMPWYRWDILDKPLIGYPEIQVTYNGEPCCPNTIATTNQAKFDFAWGIVDVYYDVNSYSATGCKRVQVYSAGLFQFDKYVYDKHNAPLRLQVYINVKPKVAAGTAGYPFNNTREDFNVSVSKDMKNVYDTLIDIQNVLKSELLRKEFADLDSLSYLQVDGTAHEDKTFERKTAGPRFSAEFVTKLAEAFATCPSIYEKKPIVEEYKMVASKAEEQYDKSDLLKFKNTTDAIYEGSYELFSKVASAVLDSLQFMDHKDASRFPTAVGVLIDKEKHGALLTGQLNILWINPLSCQNFGHAECWAMCMMDTFIHECAHVDVEYHDEYFISEMFRISQMLIADGNYQTILGKFRAIYTQYEADIVNLSTEFVNSHHNK